MKKIDSIINETISSFLSDNCKKKINEDYRQKYLPFDNNPNKPNYLQFVDYLETIGYRGTLKRSGFSPLRDRDICFEAGCDSFYFGYLADSDELDEEEWDDFIDNINQQYGTNIDAYEITPNDIVQGDECNQIVIEAITDKGYEEIKNLITNKYEIINNLIYVERVITIPKLKDRNKNTFNSFQNYDGIGIYWSYLPNGGRVYYGGLGCPNDDDVSYLSEETITIQGLVDFKDVDWIVAPRLGHGSEYEIRLKDGGEVQILSIKTDNGEQIPLNGNLVVRI